MHLENGIMTFRKLVLGLVITVVSLTAIASATQLILQLAANAAAWIDPDQEPVRKVPTSITGDNVYVAWWANNTANNNEEVIFRASTDVGITFGGKINLSNTTNADSTRAEIDSDADSVVVTWWETNQTDYAPVMRVSNNNNGETFGPILNLARNGTVITSIGSEEEEPADGE